MLHYWLRRARLKLNLLLAADRHHALIEKRELILKAKKRFPRYECSDYVRDLDRRIELAQVELDLAIHQHRMYTNLRRRAHA